MDDHTQFRLNLGKLGWEPASDEPDLHKQLRGIVLNKLASHGDAAVVRFVPFSKDSILVFFLGNLSFLSLEFFL